MEQNLNANISKAIDQRPFMGLRSYEERNKEQFGGRDTEIRDLYSLVEGNRLTIVFGKSGIGKTSLIKAGLIPELQKNYFFPIYLRIDYSSAKNPLDQAKELIYQKLKERDPDSPEFDGASLWEYFRNLRLLDDLLTPLLIIDQFEEIFTVGKEKSQGIQEFIIELSDLAENRVPMVVQKKREGSGEISSTYNSKPNFHLIISLREDYLANLESLKRYLPSIKNSRFRVLQMTAAQAMDAVLKPANKLINNEIAALIIKKLPGITDLDFVSDPANEDNQIKYVIEPFLLSLICYEINEKRIENELDTITGDLVMQFDISDVINSYYTKTINEFGENVKQGIEDSLLTEGGFRKLQELGELESEYGIKNGEILKLIEKRIIRKEMRDGVDYIELIHDVLTPVIKSKRDKRIAQQKEKEKSEAISQAIELDRGKRRRIIRTGLLMMGSVIAVLIAIAFNEGLKNSKTERRNNARKMILDSKIISNAYADDNTAALISRTSYIINRENDGVDEIEFYNAMYVPLRNSGFNFKVANIDSIPIKDIATTDNGTIYFATGDGKIYKKNGLDSAQELFFSVGLDKKIVSLSISHDSRYLAAAGYFNDVFLFDLSKEQAIPINLPTDDTSLSSKSVCFTDNGGLFLRLPLKVMGWDISTQKRKLFKQSNFIEKSQGKQKFELKRSFEKETDFFKYKDSVNFNCMTAFKDKVAIGIDSAILLITNDSVFKIKSVDFGTPSTVAFDPKGNYLFVGNTLGTLCRMSMVSFSTEVNQYQTARITDIAFSKDGNYMASSSYDRSTAIWEMKSNWNITSPLVLLPPGNHENENISCVSFSKNDQYVISGYWSGKILKWPVSSDKMADLICGHVKNGPDSSVLNKIINRKLIREELNKHKCESNHLVTSVK